MQITEKDNLEVVHLPGRAIQKAVGKDSVLLSESMTMGFAKYSAESGKMTPHQHAEEIIYVIRVKHGWVRFGKDAQHLGGKTALKEGMVLHIPALEWHVFEFEEEGWIEVIFFYGQVENIRPEEQPHSITR